MFGLLFISLMMVRACVLSLMQDGSEDTIGWKMESRYCEMCSVGQAHAETMGRPGELVLWILGSM